MTQSATRPNRLEIDLGALRHNYRRLVRDLPAGTRVIASVKADAYGHGAVEVARTLEQEGAFALATGSFDDAVRMRQGGITARILLFAGPLPEAAEEVLAHNLIPTVYDEEGVAAVARAAKGATAAVYVKVDCGLERLGVALPDAFEYIVRVHRLENVDVAGVYTHVPFEDADGREWARGQLGEFGKLVDALGEAGIDVPVTQAMASSCLMAGLTDQCSAVCPGHMLFGISPVKPDVGDIAPYRPVARSLKTRLIHVGRHGPRRRPGFDGPARSNTTRTVGVVPLGRYDGYASPLPGKPAAMLVRGRRAPVLGVSLEYATLALDGLDDPRPGEVVTALGDDGDASIDLNEIADWWGLSPLGVLITLARRIPHDFID